MKKYNFSELNKIKNDLPTYTHNNIITNALAYEIENAINEIMQGINENENLEFINEIMQIIANHQKPKTHIASNNFTNDFYYYIAEYN